MAHDGKVTISTLLDNKGFEKGVGSVAGSLGGLKTVLGKLTGMIATAFSIKAVTAFGVESSKAAMELSNAFFGLQSIVEGQGKSFNSAKTFLDDYVKDGLIPMTNAVTAYKNLASRGYDDSQIQQTLVALKDASAYGRQASYSMGDAVQSATEGLKNENSILVDNAGVTKNVAKMWDNYAKSIGTTSASLTQQQKIQAEVTGILEESKFQSGDAAKVAGTLSGQLQKLSFNFNNLKVAVGNMINPIVQSLLPVINSAVSGITRFANSTAALLSTLTGKSLDVSAGAGAISDGYSEAADNAQDLASATTEAGKAAKRSAAGFDEINKLTDPGDGAGGSAAGGSADATVSVSSEVSISNAEADLSPAIQDLIGKVESFLEPLKEIDFSPLMQSLSGLGDSFGSLGGILSGALKWGYTNVLVPLASWTIESAAPAAIDLLKGAIDAFCGVLEALQPLSEWFWDSFLEPIAKWTGGKIVDIIKDLSKKLTSFSDWAKKNKTVIQIAAVAVAGFFTAWNVTNVLTWITNAGGLSGIFSTLTAAIGACTIAKIKDKALDVALIALYAKDWVVSVGKTVASIAKTTATWIANTAAKVANTVATTAQTAATVAWNAVCAIASAVTTAFGAAVAFLTSPIGLVVVAIAALIAIVVLLVANWDTVKAAAVAAWDWIKNAWNSVAQWFDENVIQPLAEIFSGVWDKLCQGASAAWDGIKSVFSSVGTFFSDTFSAAWQGVKDVFSAGGEVFVGIKEGIVTAFKTVVNALITGINTVVALPFQGLNGILDTLYNLKILELQPFSWLTWRAPIPEIPQLAKGAVLPANKPFMAVVGDQKHGTNIEAPLSTIQEAVAAVMQDYVSANMAGHEATVSVLQEILEAVLGIQIGDDVIATAVNRYNRKMAVMRGG